MAVAIKSNGGVIYGYYYMRYDHVQFRDKGISAYTSATDDKPFEAAPAPAEPPAPEEPERILPDAPSIDVDLDAEFVEPPDDRARRIEWIKYYVREGDLQ